MSAMGQKREWRHFQEISAVAPTTDIRGGERHVSFVPKPEVTGAPVQLRGIAHGPKGTFAEWAGRESKP